MTREELKATLTSLEPGKAAGLHHEVNAELFPPGEPTRNSASPAQKIPGFRSVRRSYLFRTVTQGEAWIITANRIWR